MGHFKIQMWLKGTVTWTRPWITFTLILNIYS